MQERPSGSPLKMSVYRYSGWHNAACPYCGLQIGTSDWVFWAGDDGQSSEWKWWHAACITTDDIIGLLLSGTVWLANQSMLNAREQIGKEVSQDVK